MNTYTKSHILDSVTKEKRRGEGREREEKRWVVEETEVGVR